MGVSTERRSGPADWPDTGPNAAHGLLVRQVRWEAQDVVSLTMVDPDGRPLPAWSPGAHLDVILPSGTVRQYSLCGDLSDCGSYTVAVLRDANSRGGSQEIHDTALVGQTLQVRGPRNHFELVPADDYLFIAGGIGITPVLSMARQVSSEGRAWQLVYGGRALSSMAFVEELLALGGDRVMLVPEDSTGRIPLADVFARVTPTTAIYCCGPEGLLDAVADRATTHGLAPGTLHVERFTGAGLPEAAEPADPDAEPFEVELRHSGVILKVPPDRSILDVVRDALPGTMSSCEEGFCGTCETRVIEGVPEHHDIILSPAERERNDVMMICVGRSRTPRLVLDL
jgi:ferredoxin-NADP reductase